METNRRGLHGVPQGPPHTLRLGQDHRQISLRGRGLGRGRTHEEEDEKGEQAEHNKEEPNQAETQGRAEDQERNLKPNLVEIQSAIAEAAATCGRPKRRGDTKLAQDHPAMTDLTEAMTLRSMATHPLARFALNRRVAKCRAIVRKFIKAARAEFVLNNPRIQRRRPVAQQRIRALQGEDGGSRGHI